VPRPKSQPKYQLHKARGLAITRIDGRTIYLGKYDTPASYQKFAQVLSDWQLTGSTVTKDQLPVKNLLLAYHSAREPTISSKNRRLAPAGGFRVS